jgi:hypothetical protein
MAPVPPISAQWGQTRPLIAVFSGRNRGKIERIIAALEAGLHVLADKPVIIEPTDMPRLDAALGLAQERRLVLADMMTGRQNTLVRLLQLLRGDPEVFGDPVPGTRDEPRYPPINAPPHKDRGNARGTESLQTRRWREMDSNSRSPYSGDTPQRPLIASPGIIFREISDLRFAPKASTPSRKSSELPGKVTGSSQRSPLHAAGTPRRLHFGKCACASKRQLVSCLQKERRARPTQMADKIIMRTVEALIPYARNARKLGGFPRRSRSLWCEAQAKISRK